MKQTLLLATLFLPHLLFSQGIIFNDVSHLLGTNNIHSFEGVVDPMPMRVSGGVAVGDVNNDSKQDILLVLGDNQTIKLLLNKEGAYEDSTEKFGLMDFKRRASGPLFFNYNNDEYIDLIIGSVDGTPPQIFVNEKGKSFKPVNLLEFNALAGKNTITITAVDFDNDGYQDLFLSHWLEEFGKDHFWKNLGNGHFQSVDEDLAFYSPHQRLDFTHTSNFLDINNDGYQDLLLCSDFATSQIWINQKGGKFILDQGNLLEDENAMGSTIGDFDNDGDFDWFITSVYDDDGILEGNWGGTGNKFYVNDGNGYFSEKANEFGLEDGSWGWGTTFADFNNDGFLDLVAVNGWPQGSQQFVNDRLKIFMSDKGEYFNETAIPYQLLDTLQGRGVSCLDFDNDGDLDILVANYRGPTKLWRNDLFSNNNYLSIQLKESESNPFGFGCKVSIYHNQMVQHRVLSNNSNYLSQNPNELHFGLEKSEKIDSIIIKWKDGSIQTEYNVKANQQLKIHKKLNKISNNLLYLLYPNPVEQVLNLEIRSERNGPFSCTIHSVDGKIEQVINTYTKIGQTIYFNSIDVQKLAKGIHYISVLSNKEKLNSIPFIKQ